jgi:hypothetical protein
MLAAAPVLHVLSRLAGGATGWRRLMSYLCNPVGVVWWRALRSALVQCWTGNAGYEGSETLVETSKLVVESEHERVDMRWNKLRFTCRTITLES